jgi:hypothetical protein
MNFLKAYLEINQDTPNLGIVLYGTFGYVHKIAEIEALPEGNFYLQAFYIAKTAKGNSMNFGTLNWKVLRRI